MATAGKRRGWAGFAAWALAGALLSFAILDLPGYGLFVFPFALAAAVLTALKVSFVPEGLGLAPGVGTLCLVVALVNRDYNPCPSGPVVLGPGQQSFSCGGLPPTPWLVVGLVLILGGVVAYAATRARRSHDAEIEAGKG